MTDTPPSIGKEGATADIGKLIGRITKHSDIALALGIVAILIVLLLPMPTWMLDLSLAISITFSVLILMTVIFIKDPIDFNSFPTILLIATLLRLSLKFGLDAADPVRGSQWNRGRRAGLSKLLAISSLPAIISSGSSYSAFSSS